MPCHTYRACTAPATPADHASEFNGSSFETMGPLRTENAMAATRTFQSESSHSLLWAVYYSGFLEVWRDSIDADGKRLITPDLSRSLSAEYNLYNIPTCDSGDHYDVRCRSLGGSNLPTFSFFSHLDIRRRLLHSKWHQQKRSS